MEQPAHEITCVAAFGSRVFTGDASGAVRCYDAVSVACGSGSRESEPTRAAGSAEAAAQLEFSVAAPLWEVHGVTERAILSLCVVANPCATARTQAAAHENLLLVVGAASGELVFFHNDTEARRLQLESAVLRICAHGAEGEFLAGDLLGSLYGVNQYHVLWKVMVDYFAGHVERLTDVHEAPERSADDTSGAFFYPPTAQPVFKAIVSVTIKDVESTLSSYALLSTSQRHLLVVHGGKVFAHIPMRTPVSAIASFSMARGGAGDENVVLAAGEDGKVYRITTAREPSFRFVVELWMEVAFPIAKLLHVASLSVDNSDDESSKDGSYAWLCLGSNGQVALFRGKEKLREWSSTTSHSKNHSFPVDAAVVETSSSSSSGAPNLQAQLTRAVAVAFSDRVQLFPVNS